MTVALADLVGQRINLEQLSKKGDHLHPCQLSSKILPSSVAASQIAPKLSSWVPFHLSTDQVHFANRRLWHAAVLSISSTII